MDPQKIRIDAAEVADPRVDAILAQQGSFGMRAPSARVPDRRTALIYRPWFALMIAGALGGLAGWGVIEPFFEDGLRFDGRVDQVTPSPSGQPLAEVQVSGLKVLVGTGSTRLRRDGEEVSLDALTAGSHVRVRVAEMVRPTGSVLVAYRLDVLGGEAPAGDVSLAAIRLRGLLLSLAVFPVVAAFVGLFVAAADGLLSRAWRRAVLCGLVGLSSGLALGLVTSLLGEMAYGLGRRVVEGMEGDTTISAAAFVTQMVARGLAWAVTGAAMGLGQGIALRSRRLLLNGLLGGVVGALVGGMLFDPIDRLLHEGAFGAGAAASRAIGFMVIGLGAGLMIGVVELLARDAWLKMLAGPLAGKEFMLFKNPTTIGSSPKADIYLFKDAEVEPTHALLHVMGDAYELESAAGTGRTQVNGLVVRRARLEPGDQIRIGKTVLSFSVREGG
jgi:type III secretion system (T3SS) inner membrane Yop/YscD-like protein